MHSRDHSKVCQSLHSLRSPHIQRLSLFIGYGLEQAKLNALNMVRQSPLGFADIFFAISEVVFSSEGMHRSLSPHANGLLIMMGNRLGNHDMIKNFGKLRSAAWICVVAFTLGVFTTGTAHARDYYGAIAFSQATGAHGYSYDYNSRSAAQQRAMQECRRYGRGCKIANWFRNACGALAVGNGNGWGAEWGNTRGEAERLALQRCGTHTSNCWVRRWVCTTR